MAAVSEHSDGVITKALVKIKSGEFDVESVHTLSLKETGISDLGCIGECIALERLDLKFNDISRLHKLAGLSLLKYLNLSANRITSLDGLQSLDNLQNLNVCGNLIGSVDCLRSLSSLEHLTDLRLKDETTGLSNPMCNTSYIDEVLYMLPVVTTLDGQRVKGKGSELFQQFRALDEKINTIQAPSNLNLDTSPNNLMGDVPVTQWMVDEHASDKVQDAENDFKMLLSSCKGLYEEALQQFDKGKESENQPQHQPIMDQPQ